MSRIIFRLPRIPHSASLSFVLFFFFVGLTNQANAQTTAATNSSILILFLTNGDRVSGTVVSVTKEQIVLENKYAGRFQIAVAELKGWQATDPDLRTKVSSQIALKDNDTIAKEAQEAKGKDKIFNAKTAVPAANKNANKTVKPDAWKRQVNFAYTMTRGNVRSSDVNVAFNVSRKKGTRKVALTSYGRYGVNNGREAANLISSVFRYERTAFKLPLFAESQFEVDKLKKLDYRISGNIGLSYPVLKGDSQQLAFDFGTGVTKEEYETGLQKLNATSLLRLKASQKITERTVLNQQATFFSDLTDPGAYRIHAEASVTTPITKHLALRLAGINRYDARPQGFAKPNDFTLLTGFTFDF